MSEKRKFLVLSADAPLILRLTSLSHVSNKLIPRQLRRRAVHAVGHINLLKLGKTFRKRLKTRNTKLIKYATNPNLQGLIDYRSIIYPFTYEVCQSPLTAFTSANAATAAVSARIIRGPKESALTNLWLTSKSRSS